MIQLSNAFQNIKSTLYNLRNVCKVQYITKFITRITKMESLFYTKILGYQLHFWPFLVDINHFCHKKSKVFQNIFQNDVRMIRIIDKNIHI